MQLKSGIFIIIGLLLLVGSVAAADPFIITNTSSKSYLTAGYTDNTAVFTINVKNSTTNLNIVSALVAFSVDDATLGTFDKTGPVPTDSSGNAKNTFVSNTKSGFAKISVNVTHGNVSVTKTFVQKIDHDDPSEVVFIPPYEGTVGTVVAFNTSFTDYWGNPIDNVINPSEIHTVTLHVHGPSPDNCYFNSSGTHDLIDTPLDKFGSVPVEIRLTTAIGSNYVSMEAFDLSPQPKVITAIAGSPFTITQTWSPSGSPPELPAGASFAFVYTLYDKFGNPAGSQNTWINTTSGKSTLSKTQDNGNIAGTYSESTTGTYTVTATAVNNASATISQEVRFYSAAATSHTVVASPQTMPSRDVKSDIYSNISAKVIDEGGNGVPGETVTFTLGSVTYNPTTVGSTSQPSFSSSGTVTTITQVTGSDGVATVKFYPGAFVTSGSTYSQTATGNGVITATWNGIPKVMNVAWKNYAYLSAVLSVSPEQAKVGDTVDVNLKLNGDGWNLARKPIDVVLIIDRSGSMAWNDGNNYNPYSSNPRRITSAKAAAKTFVDAMSENTNNRVGLVSFASSTTTDQSLTNSFSTVKTKIDGLDANGATQMRRALYEAITDLDANGRSEAVKAVILLTDGDWNYDGSILAHGTGWGPAGWPDYSFSGSSFEPDNYRYYSGLGGTLSNNQCTNGEFTTQNMSRYASENGVRLYALSFVYEPVDDVQEALTVMTTSTENGFYQHAPDANALDDLYAQIATQLQEDAGVDTTADMDFGQLIVDDELTTDAMFDYVADPISDGVNPGNSYAKSPGSTMVTKYNATTVLIPGPDFTETGPLIVNQTPEWVASEALHFNIGVVKLGETWETNFRLRVLKEGTILLFSPGSVVNFKNDKGEESSLTLENLSYMTVVSDPSYLSVPTINVDLDCPIPPDDSAVLPVSWTTDYIGGETDIFEEVRYMSESGALVPIYQTSYHVPGNSTRPNTADFDMRKVSPGSYRIFVHAYTSGATSTSSPTCGPYLYSTAGKTFITLV